MQGWVNGITHETLLYQEKESSGKHQRDPGLQYTDGRGLLNHIGCTFVSDS